MKAMVLEKGGAPLALRALLIPEPKTGEVRIKVIGCAICRTDLHILDQELPPPHYPLILGHQIVGLVDTPSSRFKKGTLVGVPWLGKTCGRCFFCKRKEENLCDHPTFTGYSVNGGFAEYCVADEQFVFPLPEGYPPLEAAPLLCAGMIGYRSYRMAKDAKKIGFYGFGAAAHLLIQVAVKEGKEIFAFTRKEDLKTQEKARKLGAVWAGNSEEIPLELLDAAIIFAPVGSLIPQALKVVRKGGCVICAGIHMSPIPSFSYDLLWGERIVRTVANLTRKDGEEFLALAPKVPIHTDTTLYPLEKANQALKDLKEGKVLGSAVLTL